MDVGVFVKEYAKRHGIDEGQATELWKSMQEDKGFEPAREWLGNFADLAEITRNMPDTAQEKILPHLPYLAMGGGFGAGGGGGGSGGAAMGKVSDTIAQLGAMRIGMEQLDKMFVAQDTGANKETDVLVQKLEKLETQLFEEKEDKRMNEFRKSVDVLSSQFTTIIKKYEGDAEETKKNSEEASDPIESLLAKGEQLEDYKRRMRDLGWVGADDGDKTISPEEMEVVLLERGYTVQRPASIEEMQRIMQSELEKERERVRKEILEGEGREEKRMKMYTELGMACVSTIADVFGSPAATQAVDNIRGIAQRVSGVPQAEPSQEEVGYNEPRGDEGTAAGDEGSEGTP